eukprot:c25214_g1_i1.p3 GENE.c25214_g1_i1~~c25214_g1_i1.p3  ORF type:complete len:125 (+),score=26.33 c25214_g1_i1:36-377(+)
MGAIASKCCCCCKGMGAPKKKCTDYSKGMDGFFLCEGLAKCGRNGTVWGSGPYTADSCVCAAARHNGTISDKGGVFKVTKTEGKPSYEGSTAHGVTTSSYGAYDASITIGKFM